MRTYGKTRGATRYRFGKGRGGPRSPDGSGEPYYDDPKGVIRRVTARLNAPVR